MAKAKVQISIEDDLLKSVDDYCEKNYMNRSWLFPQGVLQIINQQKLMDAMLNISFAMKNISEKGEIDDDTRRQMDEFDTLCKVFMGKK